MNEQSPNTESTVSVPVQDGLIRWTGQEDQRRITDIAPLVSENNLNKARGEIWNGNERTRSIFIWVISHRISSKRSPLK